MDIGCSIVHGYLSGTFSQTLIGHHLVYGCQIVLDIVTPCFQLGNYT